MARNQRDEIRLPKLCKRRLPSGRQQRYAKFNGRTVAFGMADDPETEVRFRRFCAEWVANGCRLPDGAGEERRATTVGEVVERFEEHARVYYRCPVRGTPTSEVGSFRDALKLVKELYGSLAAAQFDSVQLRVIRDRMVRDGLARTTVNARTARVVRVFRWAASRKLAPATVAMELATVETLKAGRTEARETEPRKPIDEASVQAVLPHLTAPLRALVEVLWHTGARCGEIVQLRTRHVDMTGAVWVFRPPTHKNLWRGRAREIDLGPKAQAVLRPFVQLDPDRYWLRPCDAVEEQLRERSARRKTKRYRSHMRRNAAKRVAKRKRPPGEVYDTRAVGHAIRRACAQAGIAPWSPHQLRHAALTRFRSALGYEVAMAVGGQTTATVLEVYTREARRSMAADAAARLG